MADIGDQWATVARETFEYSVVPWVGRSYVAWARAWARPHPGDPRGLVQLPRDLYDAFQRRTPGQHLQKAEAERLGYPRLPIDLELDRVRRALHAALGRNDWDEAHDLDGQLRDLQQRGAVSR
jgi:hypothetical protein